MNRLLVDTNVPLAVPPLLLCAGCAGRLTIALGILKVMELIFEIRDAEEGGFFARVGPCHFHRS